MSGEGVHRIRYHKLECIFPAPIFLQAKHLIWRMFFPILVVMPIYLTGLFCNGATILEPVQSETKLCGIYAAHALIEANGISVEIDQLLVQENISSSAGSTTEDICRMLQKNGVDATAVGGATRYSLVSSGCLAILNLKARSGVSCSGHWVAFLGTKSGDAVLYDHARLPHVYQISFADLLTRWDGATIVCTSRVPVRKPLTLATFRFSQLAPRLLLFATCVVALMICHPKLIRSRRSQLLLLAIFAMSAAFFWQILDPSSLVRNLEAARWMAADGQDGSSIPRFDRPYSEIIDEERPFVLVDARPVPYCNYETLLGARLVGIELHLDEVRSRLADLGRDTHIVVYCQSAQCPWAEIVAKRILAMGFYNTNVFAPGVEGIREYLALKTVKGQ